MDPLLSGALAALISAVAAWIHGRSRGVARGVEVGKSLRPQAPQVCDDPECQQRAKWCDKHGKPLHTHSHGGDE